MEELDFRLHVIFLKRWRIYIFCGGGKEGKYLEKEKIFGEEKYLLEKNRRKRRKIFREGKNMFMEKKRKENIFGEEKILFGEE